MKHFDVLIESDDAQSIWLALKLKLQGLSVGWVNPSMTYAAALYDPYFMGVFLDEVTSQDFELLSKLYHIIKSPAGFSLMTPIGPIDYSNASLLDFYRFRSGMDSESFDRWLQSWASELFLNDYKKRSSQQTTTWDVFGSFAYLYPKELLLTHILEENDISVMSSSDTKVFKNHYYQLGNLRSKVWVTSHSHLRSSISKYTQDVWMRLRVEVDDLWTRYPALPGWTLWRNTEDVLPLYDSLFVMLRVFDDSRIADIYFKAPQQFQTATEQMTVARMIVQKLSQRLHVERFSILNLEASNFYVLGAQHSLDNVKQGVRGLYINTPELRPSWGLHHHLSFEGQLASEIQSYLHKMEAKGVYYD